MSDGLSQTAKNMWAGIDKAIQSAVKVARPTKVEIHTPLTPRVRVVTPGQVAESKQQMMYVLKPGQPLPGEKAVMITLDSGEQVVLGAIRYFLDGDVSLVRSPLVWRDSLGDTNPVKLEREFQLPGNPTGSEYGYLYPSEGHMVTRSSYFETQFGAPGTSTTTQNVAGAAMDTLSFFPPEGRWKVTLFAVVQARIALAGAGARFFLEFNGDSGSNPHPQLRPDVDTGVGVELDVIPYLLTDGSTNHNVTLRCYTANGNSTTVDTWSCLFLGERVG